MLRTQLRTNALLREAFRSHRDSLLTVRYQFRLGAEPSNLLADAELLIIQLALLEGELASTLFSGYPRIHRLMTGWVVTTADYEGPNSAFAAGRLEGRSVLDSIRATTAFGDLGLQAGAKVAMWGYSGGAIAAGWAAALHKTYAPEINLVGVAHGGTPSNLFALADNLSGSLYAGCEYILGWTEMSADAKSSLWLSLDFKGRILP